MIEQGDRIGGVRTASGEEIASRLVILADGRGSRLRGAAGLPLRDLGAPIDVFWFRVPKARTADNRTQAYLAEGEMVVCIDRGDYFQCARVIAKGTADAVRAKGIAAFREAIVRAAPVLGEGLEAIGSFDDVRLLTVSLDRLDAGIAPGCSRSATRRTR